MTTTTHTATHDDDTITELLVSDVAGTFSHYVTTIAPFHTDKAQRAQDWLDLLDTPDTDALYLVRRALKLLNTFSPPQDDGYIPDLIEQLNEWRVIEADARTIA